MQRGPFLFSTVFWQSTSMFICNKCVYFTSVLSGSDLASATCGAFRCRVSRGSPTASAQRGENADAGEAETCSKALLWAFKWLQISLVSVPVENGGRDPNMWVLNGSNAADLLAADTSIPDSICGCHQNAEGRRTAHTTAAARGKITNIHHDARGRAPWLLPTAARVRMSGQKTDSSC